MSVATATLAGACGAPARPAPIVRPLPDAQAALWSPPEDAAADAARAPLAFTPALVATCDAPPIPKDPGFRAPDGGPPPERVRLEVPFGADIKQTLDVAWPESPGPHPIAVFVHGGGWTAGDKHLFWPTMRTLTERGFVAASVNYRFARDEARAFPVGMRDARCGLAWLVTHAAELGGDPERLVLIGASAGGHMAALLALTPDDPAFTSDCPTSKLEHLPVAGAIAYYAPLELRDSATRYPPKMRQAVEELLRVDGGPEDFEARAALATPATRLGLGRPPPILLVHGDADTVVPIDDSRSFKRALDAHGVPSLLVEVHDQGHGFAVLARKEPLLPATCTAWAFLDRVAARRP